MSEPFATVTRGHAQGMITLRCDLAAAKLKSALKKSMGLAVPGQGVATFSGAYGALWMSPDEVLLLCPSREAAGLSATLQTALAPVHSLVTDVSDARIVFDLGGNWREILAKLTPADVAPDALKDGMVRRTRLGQVAAAIWPRGAGAHVVVFRSYATYAEALLRNAAAPGSELGVF